MCFSKPIPAASVICFIVPHLSDQFLLLTA
jgi:hypothetical protein